MVISIDGRAYRVFAAGSVRMLGQSCLEEVFFLGRGYYERHWFSAAIALAGLFIFGYFYEWLRHLLGSDLLLIGFALMFLFCLGRFGNYVAGKVSGAKKA